MERSPASVVRVVPCGKALTHANFYNLSCSGVCRASWVPEEGDGSPEPGVLVLEISASIQQKADYADVAD